MINFNGVSCDKSQDGPDRIWGRYKTVKHLRFSQAASAEILRLRCAQSQDEYENQKRPPQQAATQVQAPI